MLIGGGRPIGASSNEKKMVVLEEGSRIGSSFNEKKMVVLEEGYLRRGMLVNVE